MRSFFHSTENGEENSTTQIHTLDVVPEVKSGNNTVRYEYDEKRRVKSVSLNGVKDYVTYAYDKREHSKAEMITATMADGTVATSIKNAHGNVTKTTCGDHTVNKNRTFVCRQMSCFCLSEKERCISCTQRSFL